MAGEGRKFVLDTNCFIDASRTADEAVAFAEFCARAAPGLYLSAVVAAELRAGAGSASDRRTLERQVLSPYLRRRRQPSFHSGSARWRLRSSHSRRCFCYELFQTYAQRLQLRQIAAHPFIESHSAPPALWRTGTDLGEPD